MIKKMYSLYDVKSEFYGAPVLFHGDEDAKRGFQGIFQNPGSMFATYPEDYRIFCIGSFNDNSGEVVAEQPTRLVCELKSLDRVRDTDPKGGDQ